MLSVFLLALTPRLDAGARLGDLVWLYPIGVLMWTLIEYLLHRYVFHGEFSHPRIRRLVYSSHSQHHETPRNAEHILVRTLNGLVVSGLLYGIAMALTGRLFWTAGIMSGVWTGFLYYEYVHYSVHFTNGNSLLLAKQRRAHFHHHFTNPGVCFGVTTPIWDHVFGTNR